MPPIVDIHTHVYPPSYISLLQSRTTIPYIITSPTSYPLSASTSASAPPPPSPTTPLEAPTSDLRLVILPQEESSISTSRGRPLGQEYYDIRRKIHFMDTHSIDISVISLANPWLDFLPASSAATTALSINNDINAMCTLHPGRLYAFGALPLSGTVPEIVAEIERLHSLAHMRGVIMGTGGLGAGLDDAKLEPIWEALARTQTTVFLHPHYGLPAEVYGPRAAGEYGHVLPLAMGFPMETTIAVARMVLAGVFDRHTSLQVLLAHSGGTLPFLAGRLESCILHDAHIMGKAETGKRRTVWEILRENVLLDAVVYAKPGLVAAAEVSGFDRVLFGTDHPFFPPIAGADDANTSGSAEGEWMSVTSNYKAVMDSFGDEDERAVGILGSNAVRLLKLGEGEIS